MALTETEKGLVDALATRATDLENLLERVVRIDSGSGDAEGIRQVGDCLIPLFEAAGFTTRIQEDPAGRHLRLPAQECGTASVSLRTRRNIVPDAATAIVDLRFTSNETAEAAQVAIHAICAEPYLDGATVTVKGGVNRPAYPSTAGIEALATLWMGAAAELDLELEAVATGGGSDGNWTAALGIPTLDGLGPVGGNYHTRGEYLIRETLLQRAQVAAVGISRMQAAWAEKG